MTEYPEDCLNCELYLACEICGMFEDVPSGQDTGVKINEDADLSSSSPD